MHYIIVISSQTVLILGCGIQTWHAVSVNFFPMSFPLFCLVLLQCSAVCFGSLLVL